MIIPFWAWAAFVVFVLMVLILDLGVFNRKAHVIKIREALWMTAFWVSLAVIFCGIIYLTGGRKPAMEFAAGYLVEESLSVDNLFVFLVIFSFFQVPRQYQHRVLFWGIMGAIILRALFIWAGVSLLDRFHWLIYVFGVILIWTAIKLVAHKDEQIDPDKNIAIRFLRRFMPISPNYDGQKFFTRAADGALMATPLFVVVIALETTDVIFAVDSIPAILGITRDPFIVFTSNIFAILGLRAIFFALAGVMELFRHLNKALCGILLFVGCKMLLPLGVHLTGLPERYAHIPVGISLLVIISLLLIAIIASILHTKYDRARGILPAAPKPDSLID